jgi:hypothetical protein
VSDPLLAALAAAARAGQPAAESLLAGGERRGGGQQTNALVLALTRQGPLIESRPPHGRSAHPRAAGS